MLTRLTAIALCLMFLGAVVVSTIPEAQAVYIYLLARKASGRSGPIAASVVVGGTSVQIEEMEQFNPSEDQINTCSLPPAHVLCQAAFGVNASTTFKTAGMKIPICIGICDNNEGYVFATEIR